MAFRTGAEEAAAFEAKNNVGLYQSTLRKVDVIANILGRAHDRTLRTNATWWEVNGSFIRGGPTRYQRILSTLSSQSSEVLPALLDCG